MKRQQYNKPLPEKANDNSQKNNFFSVLGDFVEGIRVCI